jgi:hypothetical protein
MHQQKKAKKNSSRAKSRNHQNSIRFASLVLSRRSIFLQRAISLLSLVDDQIARAHEAVGARQGDAQTFFFLPSFFSSFD